MSSRPLGRRNRRLPAHASGSLFFRPAVSGIRFRIGCGVSFAAVLFRPVFAALPLPFPSLSHVAANPGVGLQGARPVCRSGPIALHGLFGKAIVSPTTAGRSVSDLIPRPYQTGDFASGRYGGALSHSVTFTPPSGRNSAEEKVLPATTQPFPPTANGEIAEQNDFIAIYFPMEICFYGKLSYLCCEKRVERDFSWNGCQCLHSLCSDNRRRLPAKEDVSVNRKK